MTDTTNGQTHHADDATLEHIRKLEEEIAARKKAGGEHGWTCFHCGANFITRTEAKLHFGEPHSTAHQLA